jgi:hypothetical protein
MKHRSLFFSAAALLTLLTTSTGPTSTASQNTINNLHVLNAGTLQTACLPAF